MTDKDSGKSRFKPAENATTGDADRTRARPTGDGEKTRVGPQSRDGNDKTRTAGTAGGDKTRLAPARQKPSTRADATRFKPRDARDQTRLAPPKKKAQAPTDADPRGRHVLKDRFVLEEVLGTGGMGIVYKAKDLLMEEAQDRDPYVAIKVLSEEFKTHPEAFISLQRESRKSQRVAHPNIVNVYDFDRDGETVFMTMEFLDGEPLDDLISRYKSTGLPTDEAWDIIRGMASALVHAHAERIIHSDFKPGNVFVTRKGLTKVFDFGIARAVAQVEHLESNPGDQTLFDAGTLGALTPAYASLEMLEGEEPDVRDDIYALGCVAYEMLSGEHPYRKLPADEAERQGLKPRRIGNIKNAQWRAIEKAIAFRREDRMASVQEFIDQITPSHRPRNWMLAGLLLLLGFGSIGYYLFQREPEAPEFSEFDIRNEIELQVRIDFYKQDVEALIEAPDFSDSWQESLWQGISSLIVLTRGEDPWVEQKKAEIYRLYIARIRREIEDRRFDLAEQLSANSRRFTDDETELDELVEIIAAEREQQRARVRLLAEQKQKEERDKLAAIKRQQTEAAARAAQQSQQQSETRQRREQFDVALDNVNKQLQCQGSLNMGNIETAVRKLKQLDRARYRGIEKEIIDSLATCIAELGKAFPERAEAAKKHAVRIFNSATLAKVTIKSRDPCDLSLAGLGARGKRAVCRDKLEDKSPGPDMVVIPGSGKLAPFAIGKYEVSVAEINRFCTLTDSCSPMTQNGELPAANISLDQARAYLKWLSRQTGKTYRLPNKTEWIHAARSHSRNLDPNRNCELNTRGFKKGEELVKFSVGKQNDWGLVNYVGNVQEWVYHTGRRLQAVGGSYRQPMETCTITTSIEHDGRADPLTGFRVLRELEG